MISRSILAYLHIIKNDLYTLLFKYGLQQSALTQSALDSKGEPIPWYTYTAIEYIKSLDLSYSRILEWGVGNSTVFWSRNCKYVFGIESKEESCDYVRKHVGSNVELFCAGNKNY